MTREGFSVVRREDGSIDTGFYSGHACALRKAESRAFVARFWRILITVWGSTPSSFPSDAARLKPSRNQN